MNTTIARNEQYNSFEITFKGKPCAAVRDMLKANGYRWHGKRGIWYGYKDITDQLNNAEADTTEPTKQLKPANAEQQTDKAKQSELREQYITRFAKFFPRESAKFLEWERGEIARVVELDSSELLKIAKPRIKTDFCFGYGYCGVGTPEDYKSAENTRSHAATNADYFTSENLQQLTKTVDLIKEYLKSEKANCFGSIPLAPYLREQYGTNSKLRELTFMREWEYNEMNAERQSGYRKPTADELQKILTAYEIEIKVFEKRLQTYLKKYGLTKLHTWTYLAD